MNKHLEIIIKSIHHLQENIFRKRPFSFFVFFHQIKQITQSKEWNYLNNPYYYIFAYRI